MHSPGHGIRLRSSARSDRGRVRQNNEDNVHLWAEERHVLAVVADGMGGAVAGEEASRIAIETIHEQMENSIFRSPDDYQNLDSDDLADRLSEAIRQANLNIINRAQDMPELKGMGTTVTLAFARRSDVVLAHVGDSRAYLVDGDTGNINQVTSDHSFVQALIDAGHITAQEADSHPMRNVLYRALGQAEDLEVDMYQGVYLHIGDRLVLCSDGLTLHLNSEEIAEAALSSDDPNAISDTLIERANERGGKDNISVIVIIAQEDLDEETQIMAHISSADYEDDDVLTIPNNPDFHSVTHMKKAERNSENNPQAANFGEGHDTLEPFQ